MGPQFVTRTRIWNCVRMLAAGKDPEKVRAWLIDHEGLAWNTTRPLMAEARRQLRQLDQQEAQALRSRLLDVRFAAARKAAAAGDIGAVELQLSKIEALLEQPQQKRAAGAVDS